MKVLKAGRASSSEMLMPIRLSILRGRNRSDFPGLFCTSLVVAAVDRIMTEIECPVENRKQ